ncbi:MAG TPA: glycosyltransferase, partial [Herpetosiphonaceae bacterium]|nr:glycosyltransferase [Herpetosiphonaceae bacterium]
YWFLDDSEAWTPPPDLLAFLAAGAPPVYVGFGSMAGRDPASTTRIVLEAVERSGQRAVIATGWGGLVTGSVPESVHVIEAVRHDWLFPRVAAVVHHGGAGTTAEGLRAGIPTVICPFFGDQPFWGRRIHALGLGPEPIQQKRMTSGQLAEAIRTAATDPNMRRRAAEVGAQIRSERGVEQAVRILEASLDDLPRRGLPSGEAPGRT